MARKPSNPTRPATAEDQLAGAHDQFIESWSRMASEWGISRTMAEVHALLFVTGEPMNAEDIMERLSISRGNASMTLRSLMDWGVVTRVRVRGDRKDYFQAEQDVWAMFRLIARERMKREVEPLLESLSEIKALTPEVGKGDAKEIRALNQRLDDVQEVLTLLTTLSDRFAGPGGSGLRTALKLLAKTVKAPKKA
ncbi:MAG: helix-turn-helix domain-containing protein [Phycisphaerales bacterium]